MRSIRRKGFVVVYASFIMIALTGLVSLAVDLGRVQLAKSQLRDATEAAARYAATGISDSTYVSKAQSVASANYVDGTTLTLLSSDVVVGTWSTSTKTFTAGGSSPNAVRINSERSAARSNGISLFFARLVGASSCDIHASSIALSTSTAVADYDIVGLNAVTVSGGAKIQRLASESGSVDVASNGTFTLSWGQYIYGNVLYRGTAPNPPSGCITGTKTAMSSDISFSTPTTPGSAISSGAISYGNGATYNVAAGDYSASSISLGGGATINLQGDVNVYCSGPVSVGNGCIINTNNGARKLTFYQTTSAAVDFNMSSNTYCRVFAPLSTVTIGGSTPFIGSVVAKTLVVNGSGVLNYSSNLPIPVSGSGGGTSGSSSGGTISTVK